ncbi:hypothetical protein DFJ74DRAFT_501433 [Hyaloraphidium curvatum]|nr:hypothetical protein DFJ74DRAFT_501433 [Hyaloraphidium curvatum]
MDGPDAGPVDLGLEPPGVAPGDSQEPPSPPVTLRKGKAKKKPTAAEVNAYLKGDGHDPPRVVVERLVKYMARLPSVEPPFSLNNWFPKDVRGFVADNVFAFLDEVLPLSSCSRTAVFEGIRSLTATSGAIDFGPHPYEDCLVRYDNKQITMRYTAADDAVTVVEAFAAFLFLHSQGAKTGAVARDDWDDTRNNMLTSQAELVGSKLDELLRMPAADPPPTGPAPGPAFDELIALREQVDRLQANLAATEDALVEKVRQLDAKERELIREREEASKATTEREDLVLRNEEAAAAAWQTESDLIAKNELLREAENRGRSTVEQLVAALAAITLLRGSLLRVEERSAAQQQQKDAFIADLERQLAGSNQARSEQDQIIADLQAECARLAGANDVLRESSDKLAANLAQEEAELASALSRNQELEVQNAALTDESDSLAHQLATKEADCAAQLAQKDAEHAAGLQAREGEVVARKDAELRHTLEAKENEVAVKLARKEEELRAELLSTEAAAELIAGKDAELAEKLEAKEAAFRAQLDARDVDVARMEANLAAEQAKAVAAAEQLAEKNATLVALLAGMEACDRDNEDLRKQLEEMRARLDEMPNVQAEAAELPDPASDGAVAELRQELAQKEEACAELESRLETAALELDAARQDAKDIRSQLDAALKEAVDARQDVAVARRDVENARKETAQMEQKWMAGEVLSSDLIDKLDKEKKELEAAVKGKDAELLSLEQRNHVQAQRIQGLQALLAEAKEIVIARNAAINVLQGELAEARTAAVRDAETKMAAEREAEGHKKQVDALGQLVVKYNKHLNAVDKALLRTVKKLREPPVTKVVLGTPQLKPQPPAQMPGPDTAESYLRKVNSSPDFGLRGARASQAAVHEATIGASAAFLDVFNKQVDAYENGLAVEIPIGRDGVGADSGTVWDDFRGLLRGGKKQGG